MTGKIRKWWAGLATGMLVILVLLVLTVRSLASFPAEISIIKGQERLLKVGFPLGLQVRPDGNGAILLNGSRLAANSWRSVPGSPMTIRPLELGEVHLRLRLLGLIPFRQLKVNVVPGLEVVPGGESIGVVLHSRGVLVVQIAPVRDGDGRLRHPARVADIRPGDVILAINGRPVQDKEHAALLIDGVGRSGKALSLTVSRDGKVVERHLTPVYSPEEKKFLVGLWIRDGAAGVGTMTFHHPETGTFVALGHEIADQETGRPLTISSGRIVRASIAGVEKGREGQPGEKIGTFIAGEETMGTIIRNSPFGIIGSLTALPANTNHRGVLPVAMAYEITPGPAELITVVSGTRPERFRVEIERIGNQTVPGTKGMVVHVVDERLLKTTGGIIQGMSGSPLIQRGKLIGAVTHVFINDPTRGYGIFAEWMAREAGLLTEVTDAGP